MINVRGGCGIIFDALKVRSSTSGGNRGKVAKYAIAPLLPFDADSNLKRVKNRSLVAGLGGHRVRCLLTFVIAI